MFEREHADARERDRQVRARVDPLVGELSAQGKIELALRLTMEGAREFAAGGRMEAGYRFAELPAAQGARRSERDSGDDEGSPNEQSPPLTDNDTRPEGKQT